MNSERLDAEQLSSFVQNRDSLPHGQQGQLVQQLGGIEGIAAKLNADLKNGLVSGDLEQRKQAFGVNKLPTKAATSFFRFFWNAIQDRTLIILIVSSVVSIALGVTLPPPGESRSTGWIEGTAILVAVLTVSSVTSLNDWQKDRQFRKLSEASENREVKVIRDGSQQTISSWDVLVGDVIMLATGDFIPADCLVISSHNLSVDESPMTGEPEAVRKGQEDPFLLSGCMIMEGDSRCLVICVGTQTQWGKIKASLDKGESKTPLQERLETLAENIGKMGLGAAVLTLIALIARWGIENYVLHHKAWEWDEIGVLVRFLITAITIIVVAVPEGLPLAVTLSLAYSMMRMMKDNNLVRHLSACETMGGATCICSDKTGTLTQNKMTVVRMWHAGKEINDVPKSYVPKNNPAAKEGSMGILNEGICVNTTAYLDTSDPHNIKFVGAKTECALIVMALGYGVDYKEVREQSHVVHVFPFSSKNKRMSTIIKKKDSHNRLYCKGASEVVLGLCNKVVDESGNAVPLESGTVARLKALIENWASQGLRTLTLAYTDDLSEDLVGRLSSNTNSHNNSKSNSDRDNSNNDKEENSDEGGDIEHQLEKNMTLVALVGIEDPVRPEVPDSVATCQRAGIRVRMLTGDNVLTAKSIAKKCNILTRDGIAIEGPQFRKLSTEEIDKIIPKLCVIARCSPDDKLILVKRLRELGEVVAVTGDGTNDAPILREADVGFAMGISGTEVAKDASDIVLLDDNFKSIEKAVVWGRNVFDSIRKFVQFQLTVNIVAVVVAFVGAVTKGDSPLKAVQLLWVNLIMDTLAALALATEPPSPELLDRAPTGRAAPLITRNMWRSIISQGIFQLTVLFFILYAGDLIPEIGITQHTPELRNTIIFNTFVFCQVFNELNARKLDAINVFSHIFNNYIFLGVLAFTVIIQFVLVQFGGRFSQTVALNGAQWAFCVGIGAVSLLLGAFMKLMPVGKDKPTRKKPQAKDEEREWLLESMDRTYDSQRANELWKKTATKFSVVSAFRRSSKGVPYAP